MTPEVIDLLRRLRPAIDACPRLALLSPGKAERAMFPRARVLYRDDWNLDEPRRDLRFDLIIACHVFHYAPEPARWFDNVTASCRGLLIADLIRRKRAPQGEFGPDGDRVRYAIGAERPVVPEQFDLEALGTRLLAHHVFDGAANEHGPARHLLALIRGGLDAPLLHLHGYAQAESAAADALVERALEAELPLQLSFAPGELSSRQVALFARADAIEPTLHGLFGVQHQPSWIGRWRTRFGAPSEAALEVLEPAKRAAEQRLRRRVRTYASEGHIGAAFAARLRELQLELCLLPRGAGARDIRHVAYDFAGRAAAYDPAHYGEALAIDLAAEARAGGGHFSQLLAAIATQRNSVRRRIDALADQLPRLN